VIKVSRPTICYALYFIGLLGIFFLHADMPLFSSDEGRFSEIAREMFVGHDFITPRFNYIEHFEKPVFAFLLTALSYVAFGVQSLSARLVSILSAIAGIFMMYAFTRKFLGKRTAEFSSIILATSVGYVLIGRFAMIDMLMTFLLSGSLFCLLTAHIKQKPRYYLFSYGFMGLAFITKGAIGLVLPALIFLSYLAWTGDLGEIRRMRLGWGLVIIALIFIPWGIAISMQEPEFSHVFLWKQQMARFATGFFGRKRPFWFYLPILFALAFPWSLFLPQAVMSGLKENANRKRCIQFLICWIVVVVAFFSIPKSKLPYYLLPVSMPLTMLVGHLFCDWETSELRLGVRPSGFKPVFNLIACIYIAGLLGVNTFLLFWTDDPRLLAVRPVIQGFSVLGPTVVTMLYFLCGRGQIRRFFYSAAGAVSIFMINIIVCMAILSPYFSSYNFASELKPHLNSDDLVAVYASPDHFSDFPFYLGRRIAIVGSDRGTLADESNEADHSKDLHVWFMETGDLVTLFSSSQRRAYCLLEEKKLEELRHVGLLRYNLMKREGGKILISNDYTAD